MSMWLLGVARRHGRPPPPAWRCRIGNAKAGSASVACARDAALEGRVPPRRSRMSSRRLAAAVLAFALPRCAIAADCGGGAVTMLRLAAHGLRFDGSVTRPGLTHATLASGSAGLQFRIVDAADGNVVYDVTVPG